MRALIRVTLVPKDFYINLWFKNKENHDEYFKAITELFKKIGYDPTEIWNVMNYEEIIELLAEPEEDHNKKSSNKHTSADEQTQPTSADEQKDNNLYERRKKIKLYQKQTEIRTIIKKVFHGVPDEFIKDEIKHLVFLSYTSAGQADFIVSEINPNELHIRLQANKFSKIRRACTDLYDKIEEKDVKFALHLRIWRFLLKLVKKKQGLNLKRIIEVMEPSQHEATIKGKIIESATREVFTNNSSEFVIIFSTLGLSLILFFFTPSLAERISGFFLHFGFTQFTYDYIEGTLERIDTAFLATFAVSFLVIIIKIIQLKKYLPIKWDSFDEPGNDRL